MFTPPFLIEGVTSSIISPSRRWTVLLLVSKQVIWMGIHMCNTHHGSRPTRGAWLPAICQVAWQCLCLSNWTQLSISAYRNGILSRWVLCKQESHVNFPLKLWQFFFPFPREFFYRIPIEGHPGSDWLVCYQLFCQAVDFMHFSICIEKGKQWAFISFSLWMKSDNILILERNE